mgnify:CR=1 FL=1
MTEIVYGGMLGESLGEGFGLPSRAIEDAALAAE